MLAKFAALVSLVGAYRSVIAPAAALLTVAVLALLAIYLPAPPHRAYAVVGLGVASFLAGYFAANRAA